MNKIKYIAAVLIAIAGLGFQQAQADLGPVTYFLTPHPIGSPTDDTNFLIANFGQESDLTSLFKLNSDGTTAGSFGSFFTITVISASDWMVSWNLTGSGFTLESILIKDGSPAHSGGQQLYGFYPVINNEGTIGAGTVQFSGTVGGFNITGKAISFIEFFGSPTTAVPDGGTTVMLLGAGLTGLGLVRRFLKH